MGGFLVGGAITYVGILGSGKTTEAKVDLKADSIRYGLARVVMDLEEAADWANVPHESSVDAVLSKLYCWQSPGVIPPTVIWTPRNEVEREKFFKTVGYWGRVAVLVDGVPMIADANNFEKPFRKALYKARHGKLGPTFYYLVGQRFALIHRHCYAACRKIKIFRLSQGADSDRAFRDYKVPIEKSENLNRGEYVEINLSFPDGDDATRGNADAGQPPSAA